MHTKNKIPFYIYIFRTAKVRARFRLPCARALAARSTANKMTGRRTQLSPSVWLDVLALILDLIIMSCRKFERQHFSLKPA